MPRRTHSKPLLLPSASYPGAGAVEKPAAYGTVEEIEARERTAGRAAAVRW
jgi:hypothetical protein